MDLFFVAQGPSSTGLKAMMLPKPYFPLTILFSHFFLIKDKDILEKAHKNIILYKMVYFLLILLLLSMLIHLSCKKIKKSLTESLY
jgi:hypothetical protein